MKQTDPSVLAIVGISGDLARRKLIPALLHLDEDGILPDNFYIIGSTRRPFSTEEYRRQLKDDLDKGSKNLERFLNRIEIIQADLTTDEGLDNLNKSLKDVEAKSGMCIQRLFYLAVPPQAYKDVIASLGSKNIHKCHDDRQGRLLIEKPFGHDFESAEELASEITKLFNEENIFRIDHYLAKETVQNMLAFRFRNPLIYDLWNSKFVSYIEISALEKISVESRVGFYEQTGALRDVIQSHLLQLLAITTMRSPASMNAEDVRKERLNLLKAIKPATKAARGQYEGYKQSVNNPDSFVETFAAIELEIDEPHWSGVPIYLRTGKSMAEKVTEISLVYNDPTIENCPDNLLTFRIQPDEAITLNLQAKKPGLSSETQTIKMDYVYARSKDEITHDAYEKLLVDAMVGDQKLFPSTDEVLESWRVVDQIVDRWELDGNDLEIYKPGAWSTIGANKLLANNSHSWINDPVDEVEE